MRLDVIYEHTYTYTHTSIHTYIHTGFHPHTQLYMCMRNRFTTALYIYAFIL